jgi:hypothetical protein
MTRSPPRARKSKSRLAVQRIIVAIIFGAIVNFGLSLNVSPDFPIVAKLRQDGAALGMQLAAHWNDMLSPSGVSLPAGTRHISIVDIDEHSCQAVVSFEKCRFQRVGHPELLEQVLAAADKSRAKVVIIDIVFPTATEANSSEAGRRLLRQIELPGPPIVAPIVYGANSIGKISIDWANSICGQPRCGRLVYAPAFAIDRFRSAREYPLLVKAIVSDIPARDNLPVRTVPSLVLAAAKAAGNSGRGVPEVLPILFTLPSFATLSDPRDADILTAQSGKYLQSVDYQRAQIADGDGRLKFAERPNSFLIIGSSAPITNDWHETPLGTMAGMEVVANAIRTLELRNAGPRPSAQNWLGWMFTLVSWSILACAVVLIVNIEKAPNRFLVRFGLPQQSRSLTVSLAPLLLLAVFCVALTLELGLKVWEFVLSNKGPYERTGDADIIFPVVAILFTTAVDLSQRFLLWLEHVVAKLLDVVESALQKRVPPA